MDQAKNKEERRELPGGGYQIYTKEKKPSNDIIENTRDFDSSGNLVRQELTITYAQARDGIYGEREITTAGPDGGPIALGKDGTTVTTRYMNPALTLMASETTYRSENGEHFTQTREYGHENGRYVLQEVSQSVRLDNGNMVKNREEYKSHNPVKSSEERVINGKVAYQKQTVYQYRQGNTIMDQTEKEFGRDGELLKRHETHRENAGTIIQTYDGKDIRMSTKYYDKSGRPIDHTPFVAKPIARGDLSTLLEGAEKRVQQHSAERTPTPSRTPLPGE